MMEDYKILAVDTASLIGSVALCSGTTLVGESILNVRSTHSEKLLGQISLLLEEAGWALQDLDVLAVVTGPGSFTGLRIGLATVKGLAQAVKKPVVGISSLSATALGWTMFQMPVCVFLDARKKEVYTQLFQPGSPVPTPVAPARVVPPQALLKELHGENCVIVGDGVPVYHELILEALGNHVIIPPAPFHQRRGGHVAWLAGEAFCRGEFGAPGDLLPTYIRPSDAELNLPPRQSTPMRG